MPIITAGLATAGTVSGLDAGMANKVAADLADAGTIYGLPAVVRTSGDVPSTTPTTIPDAVAARVLDYAGNFIANLPHAQGLRWLDEHNTEGAGSIDYRRYDTTEAAAQARGQTLWAPGNQIMISVGGRDIFRLVLDAQGGYRIDPVGGRVDTWGGSGAMGVLNNGMCAPEYGWRPEATEERSFDYGSNPAIGGWKIGSEWNTPAGKLVRASWRWTYKKRHLPKAWSDKKSQWLWWRSPDATNTANETCYFHMDPFTLSAPARVRIKACGDDTMELQVDGEIRATTGPGGWKKATVVVLNLSAGTHYVAGKVTNTAGSSGNANRSGFICSVAKINGDGEVVKWLRRTTPSTCTVRRQLSGAPGWFAGQVVRQLVQEQKDRNIAGHSSVTFGFSTAADSAGVPWVTRQELSVTVGTAGLDYVQQMVETGLDVAMTPGLVLNVWRTRGADRSGWIRLNQGAAHALDETAAQLPAIRNSLYARAATGWGFAADAGSIAARGARESMVSLGSSRSQAQTSAALSAMLPDQANPPQTIEVKLAGDVGPQPFKDFFVGDWVSYRPAGATTWGRHRVLSIAGEVTEAGIPAWTVQLYGG